MSRGTAITLAVFTAWPFLYMIIFMVTWICMVMSIGSDAHPEPPGVMFIGLMVLHLLTMLEIMGLLVIYLVHLFRTDRVPQDKKALWAVVLFLGNMLAMPVYWYLYVWRLPVAPAPDPAPLPVEHQT
jgi:hypothetical protein